MTSREMDLLVPTIDHFREIARLNRFAENGSFEHDRSACAICNPQDFPVPAFEIYLEVVARSIEARRPVLDEIFVMDLDADSDARITVDALLERTPEAVVVWKEWAREALATGLGLLSIHSDTALEFDLDEMEGEEMGALVEAKILEIMEHQKRNTIGGTLGD